MDKRMPDSQSATGSLLLSSWPLPQRIGGKTVPGAYLWSKSENINKCESTPSDEALSSCGN